jgi:FxLD family lantipeptide
MFTSAKPLSAVDQSPSAAGADGDRFELDVRIVEAGPVAAALLASTDDGCDTVQGSDC